MVALDAAVGAAPVDAGAAAVLGAGAGAGAAAGALGAGVELLGDLLQAARPMAMTAADRMIRDFFMFVHHQNI